jgi:DNA invertase Pin-like site-specific DNA recombinase
MTADLYIRVSTDEQADKGYSQRDQEERLRRYCELQKINIRKVLREDHSAKPSTGRNGRVYLRI